jgi:hypothetical protein
MERKMTILKTIIGAAGLASLMAGTVTTAQAADLFRLDAQGQVQHVAYDAPRQVKLCLDEHQAVTAVWVGHGADADLVTPGACATFNASEFDVAAYGQMPQGWGMVATGASQPIEGVTPVVAR